MESVRVCPFGRARDHAGFVRASSNNVGYVEVNLVSDLASNATHLDDRLVNPWGIVAGPKSVWVNDNGAGLVTAYAPFGRPFPKAISVPAPGGGSGAPTGSPLTIRPNSD